MQFKVPKKFTLKTFSICSTSISFSFFGLQVPVEKKQISMFPNCSLISLNTSLHLILSVTSNGKDFIFSLDSEISFNKFSLLAELATFQPSLANFPNRIFSY